jgi:Tol biopolymer transport system component/pimeloyl-ACP methyl ester carboxylesterase
MKRRVAAFGIIAVACVTALGGPTPAPSALVDAASATTDAQSPAVAYVGEDGNIRIWEADKAAPVLVTNDGVTPGQGPSYHSPDWSPDGDTLAFWEIQDGPSLIWKWERSSGNLERLTEGETPNWSPDGSKIAYGGPPIVVGEGGGSRRYAVYDVLSGEITRLSESHSTLAAPTWAPDSSQVVFPADAGIVIADVADGGIVRTLVAASSSYWMGSPLWSPDGKSVAAVAVRATGESLPSNREEAVVIDVATGSVEILTPEIRQFGPSGYAFPEQWGAWRHDSSEFLFVTNGIWGWDANSGGTAQVVGDTSALARGGLDISVDGRWLTYIARSGSDAQGHPNDDVVVLDLAGGVEVARFPGESPAFQPTAAPEDRKMIFIQGIDSESLNTTCGATTDGFITESGGNRIQPLVDAIKGQTSLQDEDFFYFSYADRYCDTDFKRPVYEKRDTCGGILGAAGQLDNMIRAIVEKHPGAKFDIVAHSMGGVVAAYWASHNLLGKPDVDAGLVNSIVTFDSPLGGLPQQIIGVPEFAPGTSCVSDGVPGPSWEDMSCASYGTANYCSPVIIQIGAAGSTVPFFTLDARSLDFSLGGTEVEAVPAARTTLGSSNSRAHCRLDDDHSSIWNNSGTSGNNAFDCWPDFRWSDSNPTPTLISPAPDAKGRFVACAITAKSGSDCIDSLGTTVLPNGILDQAALAGATELGVGSTNGLATGDSILINPGMPNEEENEVVGFGSVLLASPLQFDHQAGEPVVKLSAPPPLVAGWNQACYIGAEQPIDQALANIVGGVLAVYRLNASQTFDRWFPGRPDVSTITSVTPYQPLFVLMSSAASWDQSPAETPPTSTSLVQGWNNVCYAGETKSADDATSGMSGTFSILYRLGSDQTWGRFVPGRPDVSSISELNTYNAVLVLVTQAGGMQWIFNP